MNYQIKSIRWSFGRRLSGLRRERNIVGSHMPVRQLTATLYPKPLAQKNEEIIFKGQRVVSLPHFTKD